ncbi:hypothetical protein D1AOALGA4SA_7851 [Olavius algarvensis Delta 1 endosymbiont]|nr:hypothetical protein D1AOALGA4SA_7851 [Olavius algarvensis Delta 1 endosymbiont]
MILWLIDLKSRCRLTVPFDFQSEIRNPQSEIGMIRIPKSEIERLDA